MNIFIWYRTSVNIFDTCFKFVSLKTFFSSISTTFFFLLANFFRAPKPFGPCIKVEGEVSDPSASRPVRSRTPSNSCSIWCSVYGASGHRVRHLLSSAIVGGGEGYAARISLHFPHISASSHLPAIAIFAWGGGTRTPSLITPSITIGKGGSTSPGGDMNPDKMLVWTVER